MVVEQLLASGAQAGAIAQVAHEHAAPGARAVFQQVVHDELVGQSVKSIAAHALLGQ